ncbi:MAG TPA: nitrile hydratase subunit alpha [Aeromicrobium sp.]|nr:nitrile hydratase subunit alpha [Aeromicrobium sp.]
MSEHPEIATRVEALEAVLTERGLLDPSTVDAIIEHYEKDVGPLNGARVVARAWTDDAYRKRLLANGTKAVAELGYGGAEGADIRVLENTEDAHNVVVCTLCSCYPWPVLGLPPSWYKSDAYRSRMVAEPRTVLAEMGLDLGPEVRIRIWDSSAEARYMVLPQRPAGTEGWSSEQLVPLVTRDAMIGVARASDPS